MSLPAGFLASGKGCSERMGGESVLQKLVETLICVTALRLGVCVVSGGESGGGVSDIDVGVSV